MADLGPADTAEEASNGLQFRTTVSLVAANGPSVDFSGYWQRSRAA